MQTLDLVDEGQKLVFSGTPGMGVIVVPRPLGQGRVSILSVDAATDEPMDKAFVGTWRQALTERNKRAEAWADTKHWVVAIKMPVEF